MVALRWILGLLTAIGLVGFLAGLVLANNFRRSFGASQNRTRTVLLPTATMILLLASFLFPGQRVLMHATAVIVALIGMQCIALLRQAAYSGVIGLTYCALWFTYYCLAVFTVP